MSSYAPVEVSSLKQGKFVEALDQAFDEAQQRLIEHVSEYGVTAEAVVDAKIKIKCVVDASAKGDEADYVFGIATEVQVKPPKKPAQFSTAFLSEDPGHDNRKCLFAPRGGSTVGNPRQQLMEDSEQQPFTMPPVKQQ
jgi:hypothetical protein